MEGKSKWHIALDAALHAVLPLAARVLVVGLLTALAAQGLLPADAPALCSEALGSRLYGW